ncbi:glycosyl hydrolase 108 family protein [Chishuiella sp.]|uniref:glycosyl hydrolase 108 family protein n=1 Tax=Chishuiella sp. TaxID=1969467 RepID=UPI0028AEBC6A|nr:glycosyl hydrolase 108 family protein [Chishuiella sp.]
MANFNNAYKRTSVNEGGYADVKGDNGGETYKGIARNFHKTWEGWKIIDAYKKKNGPIKYGLIIKDSNLDELVKKFYKSKFWNVLDADSIESQSIADTLYDFGVNSGQSRSIKQIQKALGVSETGKVTDNLLQLINNPLNKLLENEK